MSLGIWPGGSTACSGLRPKECCIVLYDFETPGHSHERDGIHNSNEVFARLSPGTRECMPDRIGNEHNKKKPHPVDVVAGRNLMMARSRAGFTQARLAEAVGLTFQQIQKYERGANRMSLSRASEFAFVLGISITEFFEEPVTGAVHLPTPGYSRWIALYGRALSAGVASELARITDAILVLHGQHTEDGARPG